VVSLKYLLDTDALSEPMKPRPHAGFLRRLEAHRDRVAIASTTWHEALFGMCRLPAGRRRQDIEEFLTRVVAPSIPILAYDARAAEWHAEERARLLARGRAVSFTDGQIAAIAKQNDLAVVTRNAKDFSHFDDLEVEDWWR